MTKTYTVTMKMHFLQQWRLVHALAESDFSIALPEEYRAGVEHLQKYFKAPIEVATDAQFPQELITIETLGPRTRIGSLERPLIIPHEIADYCRSLWPEERDVAFSFVGLNHWGRQRTMSEWHQRNFNSLLQSYALGGDTSVLTRADELIAGGAAGKPLVFFSKRGRAYPGKIWDDEFYRFLARSRISLCPDGDQIWSYRFFESILCGAMPIVQSRWPTYEGFRYFTVEDPLDALQFSDQDLVYNFNLCRERLTIPFEDLNKELEAALK